MNSKFPVLSTISTLLRFIGLGTVVFVCFKLDRITEKGVGMSFVVIVLRLIVAAIGESIGVLFAIEENTSKTKQNNETT